MKMPLDDADFVNDDVDYLLEKGGGAKSNRNGYQYEMRYGAWELIKLASRVRSNALDPFAVAVTSQMPCYIDDLVIEEYGLARYFEMKSGRKITWGEPSVDRTLSWNFKRQKEFDERHTQNATYHLILADPERNRVLKPKAPTGVSVTRFPNTYVITAIAAIEKDFIATVSRLLHIEAKNAMLALLSANDSLHYKFDRNDIYSAYRDFNTGYDALVAATPSSLHNILDNVDFISRGTIRYQPKDISDLLKAKLHEIDGVDTVVVCEGTLFFRSRYGVTTHFPTDLSSPGFREFADEVLAGKVRDVIDLQEWTGRV